MSIAFNAKYIMNTNMEKLIENMKRVGLTQEVLAKKIKVHKIHLNKILNGRASLTKSLAKRIANIDDIDLTVEDLMFPKLPLNIVGQYYGGYKIEKFEIKRPSIQLANPVLPGWFGILYRGNKSKHSDWHFPLDKCWVEMYDGNFAEKNEIDARAIHNYALCCDDKNDWRCGFLDGKDKKSGTHPFVAAGNRSPEKFLKIKWASVFLGIINLGAVDQDLDLHIDD